MASITATSTAVSNYDYDDSWRAAISLNNSGIYLLEHHLYSEAHEVMRDAVTVLVQCVLFRQTYNPPQVHVPTVLQHAKQHLIQATNTSSSTTFASSSSSAQQRNAPLISLSITDLTASMTVVEQFVRRDNSKHCDNQSTGGEKHVPLMESISYDATGDEANEEDDEDLVWTHDEDDNEDEEDDILMTHSEDDDDDKIWMFDEEDEEGQQFHDDDDVCEQQQNQPFVPVLFRIDTTESSCLNLYACTIIANFATCMHCLAVQSINEDGDGITTSKRTHELMQRVHSLLNLAHRSAFRSFEVVTTAAAATTDVTCTGNICYNNNNSNQKNGIVNDKALMTNTSTSTDYHMHLTLVLAFVMHNMAYMSQWLDMGSIKVQEYQLHSRSLCDVLVHMESNCVISQSLGSGAA